MKIFENPGGYEQNTEQWKYQRQGCRGIKYGGKIEQLKYDDIMSQVMMVVTFKKKSLKYSWKW